MEFLKAGLTSSEAPVISMSGDWSIDIKSVHLQGPASAEFHRDIELEEFPQGPTFTLSAARGLCLSWLPGLTPQAQSHPPFQFTSPLQLVLRAMRFSPVSQTCIPPSKCSPCLLFSWFIRHSLSHAAGVF